MGEKIKRPPCRTPEDEENYMIEISMREAERKILEHKASSQLLTHFLKKASVKERLEKEKLEAEVELLKAKRKSLETQEVLQQMYAEAMKYFAIYTGQDDEEEIDEYDPNL